MRYVLGATIGKITITPAPPPDALEDVVGRVVDWDVKSVRLAFDPIDPEKQQLPVETRIYLLPEGFPAPKSADEWNGYGLAYGMSTEPIDPTAGELKYVVPMPSVAPGDYLAQVIHGFTV